MPNPDNQQLGTVTFDGAPPPGTINLGIGQPSADLLPVDIVRVASEAFFKSAQPLELNYGVTEGDARFLDSLASFLSAGYGATASPKELFVTGGNSQALDLVSTVFAKPGDTVFVEEPSYFLAFQIFRDHGLNIVGIPVDDDGLSVDALQRALQSNKPAFLYTIPSYHNPGGQSTSDERRKQIVDLAMKHDFLIVADEVYQLLYYYDAPPPAYGTVTASEHVVSLGSFSKILAPGMRLGWIQTSPNLRKNSPRTASSTAAAVLITSARTSSDKQSTTAHSLHTSKYSSASIVSGSMPWTKHSTSIFPTSRNG